MKSEAQWKDEEFKAVRAELDVLRKETEVLRRAYKEEKLKRQSLESSKTKSILLKELMANATTIQEASYLDRVRDNDKNKNTSGNLMSQLLEQKKNSQKAALATKYGARWIVRTQKAREHREHQDLYHA